MKNEKKAISQEETKQKNSGRPTDADRKGKQELAYRLFKQDKGISNKQIASMVGVTQKTAGKWIKKYKQEHAPLERTKNLLIERMNKALANPETTTGEIKELAYTIATLKPMLE